MSYLLQRLLTIAVCLACMSCAARADLQDLDALRWHGHAEWTYHTGSLCDFKSTDVVCITAIDEGTQRLARPYRRIDLTPSVIESVKALLPDLTYSCQLTDRQIRAEYQGAYSTLTHSPPPHLSERFAIAFVRVGTSQGWIADVSWSDTRGGPADEVGLRFAAAFAKFLAEARSTQCDQASSPR